VFSDFLCQTAFVIRGDISKKIAIGYVSGVKLSRDATELAEIELD